MCARGRLELRRKCGKSIRVDCGISALLCLDDGADFEDVL